ncbi:MAG: hypothetical protein ACOYL5_12395 [Phototrophicaceae bacterium]|jgi:hypothetical protein
MEVLDNQGLPVERRIILSTRLEADIIEFMKLIKRRYGAKRVSDGLRAFYQEHDPETFKKAQEIARIRYSVELEPGSEGYLDNED